MPEVNAKRAQHLKKGGTKHIRGYDNGWVYLQLQRRRELQRGGRVALTREMDVLSLAMRCRWVLRKGGCDCRATANRDEAAAAAASACPTD